MSLPHFSSLFPVLQRGAAIMRYLSRNRRAASVWAVLALVWVAGSAAARGTEQTPVREPNYKQALKYSSDFLRQFVYDTAVRPNWIGKTDNFWYAFRTSAGVNYWKVNPKLGVKEPLFDRL